MHVIYGETINDVIMKLLEKVLNEGVRVSTRNGDAITIYDVSMILRNPRSRHLSLAGRKTTYSPHLLKPYGYLQAITELNHI
jgi:hypothetical protein